MDAIAQAAESVARTYVVLRPHLDERQRRLLLGTQARELGRGGIKAVAASTGVHPDTIARGVAALTVVLYHATRGLSLPQYLGYIPFGNSLGFGHAGVDFFFVLSGFIIMHAHTADIGRPERL